MVIDDIMMLKLLIKNKNKFGIQQLNIILIKKTRYKIIICYKLLCKIC